ncbi:envelope stress response membrane protein PspC [Pseudoalteromonas sp. SR44-5]|jgi:phage shock protein C|uniref:Envelope stress response membrane protein PspC n=2 Tax=Pseudoalteromonas TaxID=53246 RepID=A0ABY3F9K1_9GAMM|nr:MULTISPECIES: envelope stress response membrane protein PspC [Pseudoalteromonas]MBB1295222.1 envelope stress response membrane protein PspC [Pseudoalteromonas sp. SR41-4]MBB1303499.1 envelope stress response membrane protein PspC [Pseudoalteromonas sp. SR44-8]MBB1308943.1 envelope stress response membrane protein PspC [Pseudoalteromonas sp. SR41-8]MBB1333811.1 envelope stress response membrane protein PspC [Pseudoalteromonas sp. SR41-6]MBB1342713.1 envelope stress response membrane protein |tara:strand:+ start:7449 stop:7850 length:402 start_codon:yes stop_codon:yes gene_type:complete|eukprot:GDKH01002680.1.p1 GENE.GDKH01002680.1~~GDKH01002680.1.p1  ORF type:complete len:134 (-),score=17.09 GDKH01002680.1:98-499(-)
MSAKRELLRDPARGKIAGVCAGLSDYFNMELWLVRIIVVTAVLLAGGPLFVVAYIAAWFILDKKPANAQSKTDAAKHEDPLEVKFKVWQKGEPPRRALQDLKDRLGRVDIRLQDMERYVTSTEFTVSREINKL